LEHLPPRLHLVISTRHDPPLPLARLRAYDRLLELRIADLRFTGEEVMAFFARQRGIALSAGEVALLEEYAGGWAVGLQLIALMLDDRREGVAILQGINGNQHSVAEYLGQEVLAQLPEQLQQFLLRTSILDQLEGGLCEAVSNLPGGEETLAKLFQAGLFLTPLDDSLRWYRYHQIFSDMLRQRLQQNNAAQIPELHRRASRWYREQHMLAEAVAHAHAAHDLESIARIAEETGTELISQGETQMVMNWVAMLPRSLIFSRLRLFLFECWWCWYAGRTTIVAEMVREYTHLHGLPGPDVAEVTTLDQAISTHVDLLYPRPHWDNEQRANRIAEMLALYGVLNMQRPDRGAFSQAVCRHAVAYVAGLPHRARIIQHLGTVSIQCGNLDEAAAALEEALASAIADENATWISGIGYRLIALYEMMGRLRDIARIAQEILRLTTSKAFLTHGTACTLLSSVEYERNNLEASERYCKLAIASSKAFNVLKEIDPYVHFLLGQLQLARIKHIRGDKAGARQCLEEITRFLRSQNKVETEVPPIVKGVYALLLYDLGDESAGRQWLDEFASLEQGEQTPLSQVFSLHHRHHIIYMRFLLVYQRWPEAKRLLENQLVLAEQQGRTGSLIQWLTLQALFDQAQNNTEQALATIANALSMAEGRGYMRTFLDAGGSLLPLFHRLHDELRNLPIGTEPTPTLGYLERLIQLLRKEQRLNRSSGEQSEQSLIEPLSEREREVLWHISEGRSNHEIAAQLILAPSTVKSHIGSIYAKLGVRSRTQALALARKLGIL
ncbi:MAG: hypothetical protein J2P37_00460, partial [Ktedonobacteraceae bacterium]|nr:hypothetical protein [Ktedonobacteraceae bacterium]